MLLRLIRCELMKWHRSPVWLAFLFLPILPALLGTLNYMGNLEILQDTWYSLWTLICTPNTGYPVLGVLLYEIQS